MSLKWWEKTVEYYFILEYLGDSISIAPLDGREERGGDAILSSKDRWLLIEFKKDLNSVISEQNKFENYSSAKNKLSSRDSHHFIIYGFFSNQENSSQFGLTGRTYFSEKPIKSVGEMLEEGVSIHQYADYLRIFLKCKKDMTTSGSGGPGLESYSLVAGINSKGKVTQCMSLRELGLELDLGLDLELDLSHEPDKGQEPGL